MDIFLEALFIITDMVKTYLWDGQNGGIEGLCQKFWSWIYSALASKTVRLTGHLFYILINGDDCRIIILLPKNLITKEELGEVLKKMTEHFKTKFSEFGFNLKLEETYYSEGLIGFGKVYLYNNSWMSSNLKKGSKIHGLANLTGNFPSEFIKGSFLEGLSTAGASVNHRIPYLLSSFHCIKYIVREITQNLKFYEKLTEDDYLLILLFPHEVGGFPVLPY